MGGGHLCYGAVQGLHEASPGDAASGFWRGRVHRLDLGKWREPQRHPKTGFGDLIFEFAPLPHLRPWWGQCRAAQRESGTLEMPLRSIRLPLLLGAHVGLFRGEPPVAPQAGVGVAWCEAFERCGGRLGPAAWRRSSKRGGSVHRPLCRLSRRERRFVGPSRGRPHPRPQSGKHSAPIGRRL